MQPPSFAFITAGLLVISLIGCSKPNTEAAQTTVEQGSHVHDASHAHYTCPMHPEVMSEKPGECPKCGMDLEKVDEAAKHAGLHDATKFKMAFQTLPSTVAANQPVVLKFTPQSVNNSTLKDLQIVHEKPLHLLMVSNDLSWFAHEHPEVKSDGSYELAFKFPKSDKYFLFADITPDGASHSQVFKLEKAVGTATSGAPSLTVSNSFSADGYEYKLRSEPTELTVGKSATVVVMVSKGGKPVTNLKNYLGALGHMVIISDDREEFLHAHPEEHAHTDAEIKDASHTHGVKGTMTHVAKGAMAQGANTNGPHVSFMTLFPKAGKYKIWVQFNVDGNVRTAQFVVSVS